MAARAPRSTRRGRRADALALAVIAAAPFAVLVPLAAMGRVLLDGDNLDQNFPLRVLAGQQIRAGHLPVWDPLIWSGTPLLEGWNAGAMFPTTWLFAVLSPIAAWTAAVALVYVSSGTGTYLLLRRLRCGPAAAFVGAAAFSFTGFMNGQVVHIGLVEGTAAMPWMLLGIEILARHRAGWRRGAGAVVLVGVSSALIVLAGDPRAVTTAFVAGSCYLAACCWGSGRRAWRLVLLTAGGGVLGAALSAVQWVAGFGFLHASQRGVGAFSQFGEGSIPFGELAQLLLFPYATGGSTNVGLPEFKGPQNLPEVTVAVGVLALMAFFAYLPDVLRRRRPRAGRTGAHARGASTPGDGASRFPASNGPPDGDGFWADGAAWAAGETSAARAWARAESGLALDRRLGAWYLIVAVGALLASGTSTPLGRLLGSIPLYNGERLQGRNSALIDLGLAVLLTFLVDDLVARRHSPLHELGRRMLALVPPAAAAGLALAIAVAPGPVLESVGLLSRAGTAAFLSRIHWYLVALVGLYVLVSVAVLTCPRRRGRPLLLYLAVALDLAAVAAGSPVTTVPAGWLDSSTAGSSAVARLAAGARYALYNPYIRRLLSDPGVLVQTALPDDNLLRHLPSVEGYGSVLDGTYATATGTHGLETLDPAGLADGVEQVLDLHLLLTLPLYLDISIPAHSAIPVAGGPPARADGGPGPAPRAPNPAPLASGPWVLRPGAALDFRLPDPRQVTRVTVVLHGTEASDPIRFVEVGAGSGTGVTPLTDEPVINDQAHLDLSAPSSTEVVTVSDTARQAVVVGAVVAVTEHPSVRELLDGSLQGSLPQAQWRYGGRLGPFVAFVSRGPRSLSWLQPAGSRQPDPTRTVPGHVVVDGGAAGGAVRERVTTARPALLVRSVTYEPGWSATLRPSRGGPAISEVASRFGLVQSVEVPAGSWIVSWRYHPLPIAVGRDLSAVAASAVLVVGMVAGAVALLERRRSRRRARHRRRPAEEAAPPPPPGRSEDRPPDSALSLGASSRTGTGTETGSGVGSDASSGTPSAGIAPGGPSDSPVLRRPPVPTGGLLS